MTFVPVANTLKSQDGRGWSHDAEATYISGPLGGGNDGIGRRSEDDPNLVAYALRKDPGGTGQGHNTNYVANTVRSHTRPGSNTDATVVQEASVRRLLPVECERLQALPDGWTDLGGTADSKRYAALGDAVTASVSEWIGSRLLGSDRRPS